MTKPVEEARVVGARIYRFGQDVQVHVLVESGGLKRSLVFNTDPGNLVPLDELQVAQKLAGPEQAIARGAK